MVIIQRWLLVEDRLYFFSFFQVYDMFPEYDLTSRKDFIKETVRKVRIDGFFFFFFHKCQSLHV